MANVLNLKDKSETSETTNGSGEETKPNRARLLSQKFETESNPSTSSKLPEAQIRSVMAARERNARKAENVSQLPEQIARRTPENLRYKLPQTGRLVDKGDRNTVFKSASGTGESTRGASRLLNNRLVNLAGKLNPEIGVVTAGLNAITNPLAAAKKKFGETTVYLMIGTAIFFDTLIAIIDLLDFVSFGLASLLVGSMFDFLALMTFTFWFKIKGAKFGKMRSLSLAAGFVMKFIPLVDLLPDWTLAIFVSFLQENVKAVVPTSLQKGLASSVIKKVT